MKTLDRIRQDPRVSEISEEGEDGIWVVLKPGFCDPLTDCHAVHEWTIKDVVAAFKAVQPCKCQDCKPKTQ